ncbi:MAG: NAD-dependent epimerase/dehydratase family protein [Flavobacteriia bacterium]|nr:NAD-dependent epimerase/dehydratase family protein [Flavobacteriia bacterium]
MSRILITGVAGFLGSHLADKFLSDGHSVIGIDNLIGGYLENVHSEVEFFLDDLNNLDSISHIFRGIDVVVHSACTAYEGLSVFSPSLVVQNTTQITANALSASVKSNVKRFIFMSSMARYGTQNQLPFIENMTPRPQDPYGIAKYASELLVKNISEVHGMEYVILVPHNIIGPRQKFDDPYRNVASIITNRFLQNKQPIIYGNGEQKRCFSFIDDVVDPIFKSCFEDAALSKIINIGPDEEFITINNLAFMIADILKVDCKPIYVDNRPQEVFEANCSANLARQILGYETKMDLRSGLTELVNWILAQPRREFTYHLPVEIQSSKTPKTWLNRLI